MVACQTGHLSALRHGNTAYRHLRGRLLCSVKPFGPHRASEYALHPPGRAFGLLGVLLEGLSGNRHDIPPPKALPQPVSSRSQIDLQPRPGPVPCRVVNASCCCLPPQRCRYSNRVLVQCQSGANAACGCLPPQRRRYSNRVLVQCPRASPEDYFPARCFSQAQAEARVSSIGRSAFQPSSFSARVGSAQMATTSPGRRGANL